MKTLSSSGAAFTQTVKRFGLLYASGRVWQAYFDHKEQYAFRYY
jgi:hypothetical protein